MGLFFHMVFQRNCAPYGSYDKCNPPTLRERTARIMIGQNARVYGDIKDRSLHHNNEQELFTNYFNNNLSRVSLARARSLFRPLLPSACYVGYFNNAGSNKRNQCCWVITIRICYRSFKKTEKKNTQICVDSGQGLYLINQSINREFKQRPFWATTSNRSGLFAKFGSGFA